MRNLRDDLRFVLRSLRNSPSYTAVVVATLGLGIATTTTVFGWIDAVLLRPIAGVPHAEELVALEGISPDGGRVGAFPHPDFRDFQQGITLASGVIASHVTFFTIGPVEQSTRAAGQMVSANYFSALGVRPALGRLLLPDEDRDDKGGFPIAVISQRLWQSYFRGDPGVVGQSVRMNGHQLTIVGVAPADFHGTLGGAALDVWVPLSMIIEMGSLNTWASTDRNARFLDLIVRLKPGAAVEQADAQAKAVAARIAEAFPDTHRGHSVRLVPLWKSLSGLQSSLLNPLRVLMAVCVLVLLIACANVANLLMARAVTRRREYAVRTALGAGRSSLVRLVFLEVLALSTGGALLGLLLSQWMSESMPRLFPVVDPVLQAAVVEPLLHAPTQPSTFLFTALAGVFAGMLCALTPALFAGRTSVNEVLKTGGRGGSQSGRSHQVRSLLVVGEVALALTALAGAGLAIRSFQRLSTLSTGFDSRNVLVAHFFLSTNGFSLAQERQFCRDLRLRMEAAPGIEQAACADSVPLSLFRPSGERVAVPGSVGDKEGVISVARSVVSPGYFALMRIPLLAGRDFTEQDDAGKPLVIIVNQTFARKYFDGQDPVGRKVRISGNESTIIGMVRDAKYGNPPEGPTPFFYGPFRQIFFSGHNDFFYVRANTDLDVARSVLRRAVADLGKSVSLSDASPLTQLTEWSLMSERIIAGLLSVLGILSVVLAALGLYSLMGYSITERTQEIGIRMALGARPREIFALVLRKGMGMTLTGLAVGLALAVAAVRVSSSALNMPIHAEEPLVFGLAAAFLSAIAALAIYLPARRATRVDPARTLRAE